jgi:Zn-dependent peptidase ImmA (M78 family)
LLTSRHQAAVVFLDQAPQTREERFAAAFAPAFIMPATTVRNRFHDMVGEAGRFAPRHLVALALAMNASSEAMCRRLEDLALLPKGTWDSLKERGFSPSRVQSALGISRGDDLRSLVPTRLWWLVAEAYSQGVLSTGQLARLLRVDQLEIRRILDLTETETLNDGDVLPADSL